MKRGCLGLVLVAVLCSGGCAANDVGIKPDAAASDALRTDAGLFRDTKDDAAAVPDAGDTDAYEGRGGPPPPGCPYDCNYACHVCQGGTAGKGYQAACREAHDCRMFCGPAASGFVKCPEVPGEPWAKICDKPLERGTLFGCTRVSVSCGAPGTPTPSGGCWSCHFCVMSGQMITNVSAPDGKTYEFSTTCTPRAFEDCNASK